jgi:hypothetical protein
MTRFKLIRRLVVALCLSTSMAWSDSLELKNGSLIKGKFMGGTDSAISFQVGSSVQQYSLADIASIKFGPDQEPATLQKRPDGPLPDEPKPAAAAASITIPAGTRISIRTIDSIDSTRNQPGDRFAASLEEPVVVDGSIVIYTGANVYGRLAESKESGTFTGRSQLRLELTAIEVNGQTVPLISGNYELTGKSRGASTAKRTIGGAAVGSIIGAIAGGGEGAAIGAGAGAAVGAGSETVTKGDQVRLPSESLLEFTLEQDARIPGHTSAGVE